MKRICLFALALLSLNTGCIFGRSNNGRPGFFSGIYNRIHGTSVGAPCASGGCGQPMPALPPMMPQASVVPGCATCGTESMSYPDYEYSSGVEIQGGTPYMGEPLPAAPLQSIQSGT